MCVHEVELALRISGTVMSVALSTIRFLADASVGTTLVILKICYSYIRFFHIRYQNYYTL